MTKAISRLGDTDVTELLQTQRRDSLWRVQDFVNRGAFVPFPMSPQGRKTAAAAAVGKNATRRRVSRIILASVVNDPNRRRRHNKHAAYKNNENFVAANFYFGVVSFY